MSIPAWIIALCPLVGLLAVLTVVWWFVRRGIGPTHRAASFGDVQRLTTLLTARPDSVDEYDAIGLTPLQYAACWNQLPAATLLIRRGADVNLAKNWPPLHYAAATGQKVFANELLEAGADINIRSKADDTTPLHVAAVKRQADMARFLIDHGASLDLATKSGWTACHFAAHEGDVETMRVLLDAGADWRVKNADEKSPLELALAGGNQDILDLATRHDQATRQPDAD